MTTPKTNVDLIRGMYQAFASGDVPGVLGAMDKNIKWTDAEGFPTGGTYTGPDAVLNSVIVPLGNDWDSFEAVPDEFIDGGDAVVVLGRYSGTYSETGKSMQSPFAHIWKVRDGKAVTFRQYTDTVLVQRALEGSEQSV